MKSKTDFRSHHILHINNSKYSTKRSNPRSLKQMLQNDAEIPPAVFTANIKRNRLNSAGFPTPHTRESSTCDSLLPPFDARVRRSLRFQWCWDTTCCVHCKQQRKRINFRMNSVGFPQTPHTHSPERVVHATASFRHLTLEYATVFVFLFFVMSYASPGGKFRVREFTPLGDVRFGNSFIFLHFF